MVLSPSTPQVGFTSSPNRRGTLEIVWTCLFTVFICIWSVVHPNIPKPGSPWWHRFLDRFIQLVLAAMAPELILAIAVREWLDARMVASGLRQFESEREINAQSNPVIGDRSIVTGFYVVMGGLQVRYGKAKNEFDFGFGSASDPDHPEAVMEGYLNIADFKDHLHLSKINLSTLISESVIQDKGKADNLIKCMLSFQVLWLTIQCICRAAQQLTITPLELSVLAYVPFMLLTLAFWWRKPYQIKTPTLVDSILSPSQEGMLVTGYLHRKQIPGFEPSQYQSFGFAKECLKVIRAGGVQAPDPLRAAVSSLLFLLFGGLHCAAWNFPFPTLTEKWMWRVSSVVVAGIIPAVWVVTVVYWLIYRFITRKLSCTPQDHESRIRTYWDGESLELAQAKRSRLLLRTVATSGVCLYVLARLCLVCQVFAGLRSLPEDCYRTVEWLGFAPGIV